MFERFGVVASTVIKWMDRYKKTGSAAPAKIGGYRPRKIIGPWRDWLLARMMAGDYTLQGLADELETQGLKVDYKTVWTFVHDEDQSFKTVFTSDSGCSPLVVNWAMPLWEPILDQKVCRFAAQRIDCLSCSRVQTLCQFECVHTSGRL